MRIEAIHRVSREHPCPCCGHADWCGYTSRLALCQRVPSERQAQNGAWIHALDGQGRPANLPPGYAYQRLAPVGARHKWYAALSRACGLDPADYEALCHRGLTDEFIRRNGYATLPPASRRPQLVERLMAEIGSDPGHIPGFYKDEQGAWCLAGSAGLLCPVRDQNFLIQAFQIRRPDAKVLQDEGPRYVWLSSAGDQRLESGHVIHRFEGTSSGAPLHHQRRPGAPVWITEGPLKADCLHHAYGVSAVALPGVGSWRALLSDPMITTTRAPYVVIAFDRDKDPAVAAYVARIKQNLIRVLQEQGLPVREATWNGYLAKGIDDAIRAGLGVRVEALAPERGMTR